MSDSEAPAVSALSRDGIAAGDPEGMLGDVLAQPLQLGDALWRAQGAGIRAVDRPGGLIVCGMGGSAIGGDLAAAALGDRATRPITIVRGYALESWTGPDSLVLCSATGLHRGDAGLLRGGVAAGSGVVPPRLQVAQAARDEDVPVMECRGHAAARRGPYSWRPLNRGAVLRRSALHSEIDASTSLSSNSRESGDGGATTPSPSYFRRAGPDRPVSRRGPTVALARRWHTRIRERQAAGLLDELPESNTTNLRLGSRT